MTFLSSNQLKQYNKGSIRDMQSQKKRQLKQTRNNEKELPSAISNKGRYNVHLISPKLDQIVHNSKILDIIESIIGKIFYMCTTLFIKNPNEVAMSLSPRCKYIGLEPYNWVTAWIALTDSNEKNGCMKMGQDHMIV